MKKLLEKIASNYYIAMAKRGKYQRIIARGKTEEISLLFDNLPNNQKKEAAEYLYSMWCNDSVLRPFIIKYGTENEIRLLFENLPDNQKEEAAETLYSMKCSDSVLRPMVIDILFKYASQSIIKEAMRSIISLDMVIARGKKEDIICYIEIKHFYTIKEIEYIKNSGDKEIISAYLNSAFFVNDEIAEVAISLKLYDALFKNSISDKIAERILSSGDKELIFAAIPQLSAVGIERVKYMSSFTKEETAYLNNIICQKRKDEEGWKMVTEIFDAAR